MDEHPNAILLRNALEALSGGDMAAVMELIADDVIWHEIGRSEPRRGKADLAASIAAIGDLTFSGSVHDVVANDRHAIALVETTVTRGNRSLTYRTAEICHIREGKVTERWAFSDDTAAITGFFG